MQKKSLSLFELRQIIRETLQEIMEDSNSPAHSRTEPAPKGYDTSIGKTIPAGRDGNTSPVPPSDRTKQIQTPGSLRTKNPADTKFNLVKSALEKLHVSAEDNDLKQWLRDIDPSDLLVKTASELAMDFYREKSPSSGESRTNWEQTDVPSRPASDTQTQTFRPPKK